MEDGTSLSSDTPGTGEWATSTLRTARCAAWKALSSLVEKATGKKLDPDMIERNVRRVVEEKLAGKQGDAPQGTAPKPKPDSGDGNKA